MIAIVDYGLGNVLAFANVYKRLNIDVMLASRAADLRRASKIILPGVGAYDQAMRRLAESQLRDTLDELVLGEKIPVLGVCVGMQMLGRSSDEGGEAGLGWIDGRVKAFRSIAGFTLPVPHMGWNDVRPVPGHPLFTQPDSEARFYFLHSFYFECERADRVAAVATYGVDFACAISADNVYGVQFHPEKSHRFGTQLLKSFAEL